MITFGYCSQAGRHPPPFGGAGGGWGWSWRGLLPPLGELEGASDANKYLYSLQKYKILLYSVDFSYLCMDNSINAYEKVIRLTIDNGDDHDTEPYECRQLYHPLEAGR